MSVEQQKDSCVGGASGGRDDDDKKKEYQRFVAENERLRALEVEEVETDEEDRREDEIAVVERAIIDAKLQFSLEIQQYRSAEAKYRGVCSISLADLAEADRMLAARRERFTERERVAMAELEARLRNLLLKRRKK